MAREFADLFQSRDPLLQFKFRSLVNEENPDSPAMAALRQDVRNSPLVTRLLSERSADGEIDLDPYKKWNGVHWVLAVLADMGYPPGDERLRPLVRQDCDWISSEQRLQGVARRTKAAGGPPVRACGSMEGATIFSMIRLGFMQEACHRLVERLLNWQWPDGGWNCDMRPAAVNSSFMETVLPLRALALYSRVTGDQQAGKASEQAAEIFLKRQVFRKSRDGSIIDKSFMALHYPCYWHYDVLNGLKALAESGFINDPRCSPALDWLESRRLPDGEFPADAKYYHRNRKVSGFSLVDWGPISTRKSNPFVTVDALYVLRRAGRV